MNDSKPKSRSFSKRKTSYAPIMLTSKAVKPFQRQQQSQSNQNHKFRSKLSRPLFNEEQNPKSQALELDVLNRTQINCRQKQFDKTFSHSCKKTRLLEMNSCDIINANKLQTDEIYNEVKKNREFDPFYMRQTTPSVVVNVQFNEDYTTQKFARKNNLNTSTRYNIIFGSGNSAPNTNRPYKSVSGTNTKPHNRQMMFIRDGQEVVMNITDQKAFKLFSSSPKKTVGITTKKPIQSYFWLKDPNRKLMLAQKQRPFDLTFTNFKQKIYEKKINKISNQKNKYSQEWNQYLNKYYLNIKKVKPLIKFDGQAFETNDPAEQIAEDMTKSTGHEPKISHDQKSSTEGITKQAQLAHPKERSKMIKINSIQQNIFEHSNSPQQKIQRIRSSTLMTSSKTASLISTNDLAPLSPQKAPKSHQSDLVKIQSDISTKRISLNRKDYFVFSMGDSSNKQQTQNPVLVKFGLYKDWLWKVNYSNGLYIRLPDDIERPYKFFVGKGNNSSIIKGIMRRRFWWQLTDKITPQVNFVWTQLRVNDFVKSQKKRKHQQIKLLLDNHTYHQPKTDSSNLILKQTQDLHKKVFRGQDLNLWISHFQHHQKNEQKFLTEPSFNILQKRIKSMVKKKRLTFIDSNTTAQQKTHNHFQCNFYIGNKKALFYAMRKYYQLIKQDPFDYIPLTFHISGGLQDPEFGEFLQRYNLINDERMKNKSADIKNIWIVKPGQVTNRGRGITVCATLDQIKIRLKSKEKNSDGSLRTYILQKYIQKPFLYQKRKFDIRHYMLMNCTNGAIKGYWYEQGYIRTTSTEYNIKNCKDLFTHLTNDAIQKTSADYGKFQKGNKISYQEFQKYLVKNYRKDFDFFQEILPKMKKLATDAMRATYSIIEPNRRENNFELFGLDFMIDQSMKVYLIECNTNPCLELSCPLLSKIISGLVENVFKLCIDPIFPPPFEWPLSKKFQLGQNPLIDQKFELVFDQIADGKELQKLYGAEKGLGSKIGKVEEQDEEYEDGDEQQEWNGEDEINAKA